MTGRATTAQTVDGATLGHRIRHFRKLRGMTLDELGQRIGKTAPFLSMLENGKREPRLGLLNDIAAALDVDTVELMSPQPPTRRAELELALTGAQDDPLYAGLGLPRLRPSAKVPDLVLEHLVGLYRELRRRVFPTVATREEARIANAELRAEMRERGNYFAEIEQVAAGLVTRVGYRGAALTEGDMREIAAALGFTVHRSQNVPSTVRSVTDLRHRVIHIPQRDAMPTAGARSVIMQTLGHFALEHRDPVDFADFLRQRVEANYFAGAVLLPEVAAVPLLDQAKAERDLAIEDLRDAFSVSYEMAAHRFTNLATEHLGLRTHFVRSDEAGIIWKAYENNDVPVPAQLGGCHRRSAAVPGVGDPAGVRVRRQVLDALPVHRHRRRHLLVRHPRRSGEGAGGGDHRGSRVRRRPVLPGQADQPPLGLQLPRRRLLPASPSRPGRALGGVGVVVGAAQQPRPRRHAGRDRPRCRRHRDLRVPRPPHW